MTFIVFNIFIVSNITNQQRCFAININDATISHERQASHIYDSEHFYFFIDFYMKLSPTTTVTYYIQLRKKKKKKRNSGLPGEFLK